MEKKILPPLLPGFESQLFDHESRGLTKKPSRLIGKQNLLNCRQPQAVLASEDPRDTEAFRQPGRA